MGHKGISSFRLGLNRRLQTLEKFGLIVRRGGGGDDEPLYWFNEAQTTYLIFKSGLPAPNELVDDIIRTCPTFAAPAARDPVAAYTSRGFRIENFTDSNGLECRMQVSSRAGEEAFLWLGCNEIGLKRFDPHFGWSDVDLRDESPDGFSYIANTMMSLSQSQVRELLPALRCFAETGDLPTP